MDCFGNSSGAINATVIGGTAPFNYNWSSGHLTEDISNLDPGIYELEVIDQLGCRVLSKDTVFAPITPLSINFQNSNESTLGAGDGLAIGIVNGGTAPYSYSWNTVSYIDSVAFGLNAGTIYIMEVVDDNGCYLSSSTNIDVNIPPCNAPVNVQALNIQENSMTITWAPDQATTGYEIQYRESGTSVWTTYNSNFSIAILSNLKFCTEYEVRIKTNCPANSSNYSNIERYITAGCTPACEPVIGLYEQNITDQSTILVWDLYAGADYTIYYRELGVGSWFSYDSPFPLAVLFGLTPCTTYEWYVIVHCPTGLSSSPSPISIFGTSGNGCAPRTESDILGKEFEIKTYPNPVNAMLNIEFWVENETDVSIQIVNASGQLVEQFNEENLSGDINIQFNTNELATGVYFGLIHLAGEVKPFNFIKE